MWKGGWIMLKWSYKIEDEEVEMMFDVLTNFHYLLSGSLKQYHYRYLAILEFSNDDSLVYEDIV